MKTISNLFGEFVKLAEKTKLPDNPIVAGAWISGNTKYDLDAIPIVGNLATGFVLWWRATKKSIWRLNPKTADKLRTVNLGFIPEDPPESWTGQTMVIEAVNGTLFRDVFSMMAYKVMANAGHERYFLCMLTIDGNASVSSIRADALKIDTGKMLDMGYMRIAADFSGDSREEYLERSLDGIKFLFATSYYALEERRVEIKDRGGPIQRNQRGKPIKKNGKVLFQWQYLDMDIRPAPSPHYETGRPIDKENLLLEPVIVSPYIRMMKGKAIIVDAHHSHRWKRDGEVAAKIRL
jgi:hypothetical protein